MIAVVSGVILGVALVSALIVRAVILICARRWPPCILCGQKLKRGHRHDCGVRRG